MLTTQRVEDMGRTLEETVRTNIRTNERGICLPNIESVDLGNWIHIPQDPPNDGCDEVHGRKSLVFRDGKWLVYIVTKSCLRFNWAPEDVWTGYTAVSTADPVYADLLKRVFTPIAQAVGVDLQAVGPIETMSVRRIVERVAQFAGISLDKEYDEFKRQDGSAIAVARKILSI